MSIFELMAAPFVECLVLVGIHTYLGIHVLRRRVIFVDLALAQIAVLGTMIGFLFGVMPETPAALIVSMAFTFMGAAVFALTRIRSDRIPQEAVIGLVYAITAAMAVLVVEKTQGGEHLKEILVGSILWVKWADVGIAAAAYSVVGVVHYVFRRQFFLISEDPEEAYRQGMSVRAWDFFFYVSFGFVISFSVKVAGVLLVFVFLVAPAIMAFMLTDRLKYQLIIGWVMGTLVTLLGLFMSYVVDLPSGPTVVAFYGVVLALGAVALYVARSGRTLRALGWVGTGVAGLVVVCLVFGAGTRWLASTSLAISREHETTTHAVIKAREKTRQKGARRAHVVRSVLASPGKQSRLPKPCWHFLTLTDAEERLEFIKQTLELCRRGGLRLLFVLLSDPETSEFFRSEGVDLLKQNTGQDFGYDAELEPAQNKAALNKLLEHLRSLPPPRGKKLPAGIKKAQMDCYKGC